MDTFVKILSWIWIPITNLAGKFMTNSLVTGEVLKIADFLFQGWSLSRTIVNFVIVGAVLTIIWDIIKSGTSKDLGTKISKLVITAIAVNLSRFAISAMVDLGTLALLGVSNMGTSIIDSLPIKKILKENQIPLHLHVRAMEPTDSVLIILFLPLIICPDLLDISESEYFISSTSSPVMEILRS